MFYGFVRLYIFVKFTGVIKVSLLIFDKFTDIFSKFIGVYYILQICSFIYIC